MAETPEPTRPAASAPTETPTDVGAPTETLPDVEPTTEPELAPVRTALFCGLGGALGASAGWLLWIVVPQVVADPRGTVRAVVTGWLVGFAVEAVRWYRRLSRDGSAGLARPLISLVVLPLAVLVFQTGAEDAVAELADAVVVPLVLSLSLFFLVGAMLGFFVFSWLPSGRGSEPADPGIAAFAVVVGPFLVPAGVAMMTIGFVVIPGYLIGRLVRVVHPGAPVTSYLAWLLLVVIIAVSTFILAWRSWAVVLAWVACCAVMLGAVATPFFVEVDAWTSQETADPWLLIIPLSESILDAPDVPAAAWLQADRELAAASDPTARSRAAVTEDALNRALRRRLDCGTPAVIRPPEGNVDAATWRRQQLRIVARHQHICETLTSPDSPGLTRSLYVESLFALGAAAAPWVEERTRPKGYQRHILRLVDSGLLLALITLAVVALAVF